MANEVVFLFGAGASFGCKNVVPFAPPKGNQLFSELRKKFPETMEPIIEKIGNRCNEDFEKKMQEIVDHKDIELIPFNKILAKYISTFQLTSKDNTYSELIHLLNIKKKSFVLCTLNYDCLLEFACSSLGIYSTYDSDVTNSCIKILKLHGSCNFVLHIENALIMPSIRVDFGGKLDGPLKILSDFRTIKNDIDNSLSGPVISYYMQNKPTNIGVNHIEYFQDKWKKVIFNSKKIIIIGVRPNFEDKHVWNPIERSFAQIAYVGSKNGFDFLTSKIKNTCHIAERFEESIPQIEQFLCKN